MVAARAAGGSGGPGPQKILLMGGTRFIGVYLARTLIAQGHDVHILTRGKKPVTFQIPGESTLEYDRFATSVKHIACDRKDYRALKGKLQSYQFDVVYDMNAREAEEVQGVLDAVGPNLLKQYVFCSSAGVYLKSDMMPHLEEDAVDPASRHKGKLNCEDLLKRAGVPFTSIRPVYIYGPLNYNPVEEYFFHRIAAGRPVCIPGSGMQITQLGHVADLADAFAAVLLNPAAKNEIFNIAGDRYVTWDGLAKACAQAAGKPEPRIVHYDPKQFKGKFPEGAKAFPFRDQHFYAGVHKARAALGWQPRFDLVEGLRDSWQKDYAKGRFIKDPDFTCDDIVLRELGVRRE